MKTALVLGGTGTIGHQLCKRLRQLGYWVRCVDRKVSGYASDHNGDSFIKGDLRDGDFVNYVFKHDMDEPFDLTFALNAEMGGASYIFSKDNDSEIIFNSAIMNLHTARVASLGYTKKILFSSSACCYPESVQMESDSPALTEDLAWKNKPDSAYGIEKLFSEEVYDAFHRNNGLDIRICRFHNVFSTEGVYKGGREKAPSAICRKVAEAPDGGEIEIWGDGLQERSFLWIEEALDGVMKLMESDYHKPVNIGSDERISINNLAKMVIDISGKKLTIRNVESNALGVRGRNSENSLIEKVTGWRPHKPLREGMEILYKWVVEQVEKDKINK